MKKTFGWLGMPTAPTVGPPRNGPIMRQRMLSYSLGSNSCARTVGRVGTASTTKRANARSLDMVAPFPESRRTRCREMGHVVGTEERFVSARSGVLLHTPRDANLGLPRVPLKRWEP